MTSQMFRRYRPALLCVCLLSLAAPAAAQDDAFRKGFQAWRDKKWAEVIPSMQQAIKAQPRESNRKVRAGGFGIFGGGETEYLPHFYLGDAYYQTKDCARALEEWETSDLQGVIRNNRDLYATLQAGLRACDIQGYLLATELKSTNATAQQAYDVANNLATKVAGVMSTQQAVVRQEHRDQYKRAHDELVTARARLTRAPQTRLKADFDDAKASADRALEMLRPVDVALTTAIAAAAGLARQSAEIMQQIQTAENIDRSIDDVKVPLTPELNAMRTTAREQIGQARDRLATGLKTQSAATIDEASKYVQSASTGLNDVLDRARREARSGFEQKFGDTLKAAEEQLTFIDSAIATIGRLGQERQTPEAARIAEKGEAIRKDIEAQRRRLERARASEDLASIERVLKLTAERRTAVDELLKSFGSLTLRDRGVHEALEQGARLYFQGEYQNALTALSPATGLTDILLQIHVHLLRAAASYALWMRSGGTKEDLKAAALKEIEQCKQLNSTFQPDQRYFSPAFIAFYQQGRP
jgi:hypothetical protein